MRIVGAVPLVKTAKRAFLLSNTLLQEGVRPEFRTWTSRQSLFRPEFRMHTAQNSGQLGILRNFDE